MRTVPELDELIAEVDRTCADAAAKPDQPDQPDWLTLLSAAAELAGQFQAVADDLVEDYVEHCRLHGYAWSEIGLVLGVTRQAAQQRFLSPHREHDPDTFASELRSALSVVKQTAVEYHNNFIGTEHLLCGLTAEANSATRLLEQRGLAPGAVHRKARERLTIGASRAAERIAFTPYSRKALALALAHDHAIAEAAGERPLSVECRHVLSALVGLGRGAAVEVLRAEGLAGDLGEASG